MSDPDGRLHQDHYQFRQGNLQCAHQYHNCEGLKMFAIVRLRGEVNVRPEIKATLAMLHIHRVNHCIVVKGKTPIIRGNRSQMG